MAIKKKRKKRKKRKLKRITYSTGKFAPVETLTELKKKFPKELLDAFIAVKESDWDEEIYEEYVIEVRRFLGEEKADDRIESGKLVVQLAKITMNDVDS